MQMGLNIGFPKALANRHGGYLAHGRQMGIINNNNNEKWVLGTTIMRTV